MAVLGAPSPRPRNGCEEAFPRRRTKTAVGLSWWKSPPKMVGFADKSSRPLVLDRNEGVLVAMLDVFLELRIELGSIISVFGPLGMSQTREPSKFAVSRLFPCNIIPKRLPSKRHPFGCAGCQRF